MLLVGFGTACLVTGFFFKQTAIIFTAVPLLALVLRWRKPSRSEIVLAVCPLAVALGVILALRILSPTVYYYMIDVPKAFGLDGRRTARMIWDLLLDSPLFLVLFTECILLDPRSARHDPRVRWLLAVLVVAIPLARSPQPRSVVGATACCPPCWQSWHFAFSGCRGFFTDRAIASHRWPYAYFGKGFSPCCF